MHCVELLLAARASVHHVAGDGHTPTTLARVMRAERPELGHVFGKVIALLRAEDSFGAADHDGGSLPPGLCATVVGLQAASELNGRVARVLSFDEGRGRYGVQVGTPTGVRRLSIRPANLRTEPPELPGGGAGNQLPQPPIRAAELALVLRSGQSRWFGELVRQTSRTELAQLVTLPGVSGEVPLLHSTLMVHVAGNRHASEECARALVEAGADVNVRCQIGANGPVVTPLRLACESGNVGACRLLLDAKAWGRRKAWRRAEEGHRPTAGPSHLPGGCVARGPRADRRQGRGGGTVVHAAAARARRAHRCHRRLRVHGPPRRGRVGAHRVCEAAARASSQPAQHLPRGGGRVRLPHRRGPERDARRRARAARRRLV